MKPFRIALCLLLALSAFAVEPVKWTPEAANLWYSKQPWYVGVNYIPASAINQIEMWNAESFDPVVIDTELGWAQAIGMNAVRVFLHEIPWKKDPSGCAKRINTFLRIADKHKINVIFVLFDSVWSPFPEPGIQRDVRQGVHNSGWVQDPGAAALVDEQHWTRLSAIRRGRHPRIHHRQARARLGPMERARQHERRQLSLVRARQQGGSGDAHAAAGFQVRARRAAIAAAHQRHCGTAIGRAPISSRRSRRFSSRNRILSAFTTTTRPPISRSAIQWLQQYHRPILCTEYMARERDSHLPEHSAHREEVQRGRIQLGPGRGKDANLPAVGFLATSVCRSPAGDLASRYFPRQRIALLARRDRFHPPDYRARLDAKSKRKISPTNL